MCAMCRPPSNWNMKIAFENDKYLVAINMRFVYTVSLIFVTSHFDVRSSPSVCLASSIENRHATSKSLFFRCVCFLRKFREIGHNAAALNLIFFRRTLRLNLYQKKK